MRSSMSLILRSLAVAAGLFALLVLAPGGRVRAAVHDADEMGGHMTMTDLRPMQPGDKARADAIVAAARAFAGQYTDYRKALADGYSIYRPDVKQNVYHFTNRANAPEATIHFDPAHPMSLLYERVRATKRGGPPQYKLVGVMYSAPYGSSAEELNRRVPLSIARWHLHTNLCLSPTGKRDEVGVPGGKFGLLGSIVTAEECQAAGGRFLPHIFDWMVHVYPYETDPAKIWAPGMDYKQNDDMPDGMPM